MERPTSLCDVGAILHFSKGRNESPLWYYCRNVQGWMNPTTARRAQNVSFDPVNKSSETLRKVTELNFLQLVLYAFASFFACSSHRSVFRSMESGLLIGGEVKYITDFILKS